MRTEAVTVTLSPMQGSHLNRVLEIEAESYPKPWTRSLFRSELALRTSRAYYVALVDGDIAGYGGLMMVGDEGHVTNVAVDPERRRHGIATRLLVQLVREAIRRGAGRFTLEVRTSNAAAQAMYRRFGLAPVGVRRRYYGDTGEDAVIMSAMEIAGAPYLERVRGLADSLPGVTVVEEAPPW